MKTNSNTLKMIISFICLTVREEIARLLPKVQGRSYREATKQMNARLYTDLLELKNITY